MLPSKSFVAEVIADAPDQYSDCCCRKNVMPTVFVVRLAEVYCCLPANIWTAFHESSAPSELLGPSGSLPIPSGCIALKAGLGRAR